MPEAPPAMICSPSGQKAHTFIAPSITSVVRQAPVRVSQTFTVLSADAETIQSPWGLIAHFLTSPVWPRKVSWSLPVRVSQTFKVISEDADTIQSSSGLIAQAFTQCFCS